MRGNRLTGVVVIVAMLTLLALARRSRGNGCDIPFGAKR